MSVMFICPIADKCISIKCGHRKPHPREHHRTKSGTQDICASVPWIPCPPCVPVPENATGSDDSDPVDPHSQSHKLIIAGF